MLRVFTLFPKSHKIAIKESDDNTQLILLAHIILLSTVLYGKEVQNIENLAKNRIIATHSQDTKAADIRILFGKILSVCKGICRSA